MSDTSTIDEKKKKTTLSGTPAINFAYSLSISLISLGLVLVFGSLFLYIGKIAQSNILPTCTSHEPYTFTPQTIGEEQIDINIIKTDKGIFSTKLKNPIQGNMETINKTLGFLREMIYGANTNVLKLYAATTLQQVIAFNFLVNNTIYNFINYSFTESLIVLLTPFITLVVQSFVGFMNAVYLTILWFYNIYLLFSIKKNVDENGKRRTSWVDGNMWGIVTWYWSIAYIILFFILFLFIGAPLITFLSFSIACFCLFFPLSMKLNNADTGKPYTISDTIRYILKFKMNVIMFLISFFVILTTNSNFGGYTAFVSAIACSLLFFFSHMYQSAAPSKITTPSIGLFFQAEKTCEPIISQQKATSMFQKIKNILQ